MKKYLPVSIQGKLKLLIFKKKEKKTYNNTNQRQKYPINAVVKSLVYHSEHITFISGVLNLWTSTFLMYFGLFKLDSGNLYTTDILAIFPQEISKNSLNNFFFFLDSGLLSD